MAGFSEPEINIEVKENTLRIRGDKQNKTDEQKGETLYQGIAARAFERVFQLAEHVEVKGASLENGLLHVDLVRESLMGRSSSVMGRSYVLHDRVARG